MLIPGLVGLLAAQLRGVAPSAWRNALVLLLEGFSSASIGFALPLLSLYLFLVSLVSFTLPTLVAQPDLWSTGEVNYSSQNLKLVR